MYQHGKRSRRKTNPKVFLYASALFSVSLIATALILQKDLHTNVAEKTTVPIITEVTEDKDVITINEPLFSIELPSDWVKSNRVQTNSANYYEWKSTKKGAEDRTLRLHIDTMPATYKLVRLLPLTPKDNKFSLGNISNNCINFAKDAGNQQRTQGNAAVEAKWEGVTFQCDPINNNQTIGTGTIDHGIAARLKGSSGEHAYFFYYEDHNIRPDDKILTDAIKSFAVK